MRKVIVLLASIAAAAIAIAVFGATASGRSSASKTLVHDHALIDTTGGDVNVICRGQKSSTTGEVSPFEFYASLRAFGGDAVARVTFKDSDYVDFPIPNDTSFSLSQAAGGTASVDQKIVITRAPGSTGHLVGWVSASAHTGTVLCETN
jgi:hypothetical protein